MADLTAKQERFVDEYLIDLNGTQAAIRAGYSENTARQIACEMLTKLYIQDAIASKRAEISERNEVSQDMIIKGLRRFAFADYPDVLPDDLKPALPIKESDMIRSLELLGKHLGMFTEKREISGPNGSPVQTQTVFMPVGTDDE